MIPNAHSSALVTYVSRIRMVNTGTFSSHGQLTFSDASTGIAIGSWTSPEIPSGGSIDVPKVG